MDDKTAQQLLPRPQRLTLLPGRLQIPARPTIRLTPGDIDLPRCRAALTAGLKDLGLAPHFSSEAPATIDLRLDPGLGLEAQGYRLDIRDRGATLSGRDPAGLFYGVHTLLQWISLHGPASALATNPDGPEPTAARTITGIVIEDWPDFAHRGVLLDISRDKVPAMETLGRLVERLAGWKVNQLQLYTEHTFAYAGHEDVWADASPMRPEEVRALDALCHEHFIELVPNQNSFGHFHRWLTLPAYRQLAECPEGIEHPFSEVAEPFSLCPIDPGAVALLADLYGQLLPNFRSRQFNVGLDETLDLGCGRSAETCRRDGREEVYLGFLEQVHALARHHDRQLQFWADIVIKRPDLLPRLPPGVTALEWGYEPDHPFDEHLPHLQRAGVPFYVCPGTSSWNSLAGRAPEALLNIQRAARSGQAHGAAGLLLTDWGDNGHLQPLTSSYVGLVAGAAAGWNSNRCADPTDIADLLNRHVYRDATGRSGRAATGMASAHRASGALPKNGTALFRLLQAPGDPLTHPRYRGLSAGGLSESERLLREALDLLGAAKPTCSDAALVSRELSWVGELLQLACELGRARLRHDLGAPLCAIDHPERQRLTQQLAPLVEQHESIWLGRNRPGGRLDSVRRLQPLQRALLAT